MYCLFKSKVGEREEEREREWREAVNTSVRSGGTGGRKMPVIMNRGPKYIL
jgi:hypothetical protein